ncbi:LysR family transcriptional regulator [Halomonas cupida]|uniref:LysR family transcriptional regulator n=1 Tax=Halomonas cupida TaxID=44933 RepID=UPI0039B640CA
MARRPDITVSQLGTFLHVIEEGSFTGAARRLGVSQSGVSHSIASLERLVGHDLIYKQSHPLQPTGPGEVVLASARRITFEIEQLHSSVEALHNTIDESLCIACIPSVSQGLLEPFINEFNRQFPQSIGLILEGVEEEVKDWVEGGIVDIGITTDTTIINHSYWHDNFSWIEIKDDEIHVAMPKGHPLEETQAVDIEKVPEHPLIMSSGGCEALVHHILSPVIEDETAFQVDFWVRNTATLLNMVEQNVGISLIPELALQKKPQTNVVLRRMNPPVHRTIIAFWPRRQGISRIGGIFTERLKAAHTTEIRD